MTRRGNLPELDWFRGVEVSGLVLSEPVLAEVFPNGFPDVSAGDRHWFRRRQDRYRLAREQHDRLVAQRQDPRAARKAIRQWIDYVLEEQLGHPVGAWAKSDRIPDALEVPLPSFRFMLKPDRVLLDREGEPALPVLIVEPTQGLDRRDARTGTWKVTPSIRLERLLREAGLRIGLVTNGEDWRLLHCPPGAATGWIQWSSDVLAQEPVALASFRALLSPELLRPADAEAEGLPDLCAKSLSRQAQIADQLGVQVLEGIELLLEELDRLDRESGGELLGDLDEDELYQVLVVVLMRVVFLLYAEENRLVPHGELLYDQAYGVTHLWQELVRGGEETGERIDAWRRLLATARLVHIGCDHPDLLSRAYGGLLFDPGRSVVHVLEDPRCRVRNRVVREVLEKLLWARPRRGGRRQRVGYWSLDVEELGYLYEGLLDRGVKPPRSEPLARFPGDVDGRPLGELEALSTEELVDLVAKESGRKSKRDRERIAARLAEGPTDEQRALLLRRHSPEIAQRLEPFAPLLDCARCVEPGRRSLGAASTRRASGAHYTPQFLTEQVVRTTLEPLVFRCEEGRPGDYVLREGRRVLRSPRELLSLKIADIAMGSGAFLVQVVRYLGDLVVETWREAAEAAPDTTLSWPFAEPAQGSESLPLPFEDAAELRLLARRAVAERCVYGVDVNPYAVEMAKLSLWIVTLAKDHPFTFLDHALKCGDSLVGASREQLERGNLLKGGALQHPPGLGDVAKLLGEAREAREAIRARPVLEAEDTVEKAAKLEEAERSVDRIRLVGDLLVGSYLAESSKASPILSPDPGRRRARPVQDAGCRSFGVDRGRSPRG